ncbi:MAG TPA: hypothetical protein VFM18_23955 [Methanosarcina sp.]|nr:hypothetical protein [Methanosarcina sp.]
MNKSLRSIILETLHAYGCCARSTLINDVVRNHNANKEEVSAMLVKMRNAGDVRFEAFDSVELP